MQAAVFEIQQYRQAPQQTVDPIEHLYRLERDLASAERRTTEMLAELTERLSELENRVSHISERSDEGSRRIERDLVALAGRVEQLEKKTAVRI